MSYKKYNCIIIGGGPSAVHAAFPLVESGLSVLMIDGGIESKETIEIPKPSSFDSIRKNMINQHELFLGKDVSGASPLSKNSQSDHMSSGRFSYISEKTDVFLPVDTQGFYLNQTLAKGGMTEIWGGASDVLDEEELSAIGIKSSDMHDSYQTVIDRIGISGSLNGYKTQKATNISTHSSELLKRYSKNKKYFDKKKLSMNPSALALLTDKKNDRDTVLYNDLQYWNDEDKSLYKARYTIEELQKKENFDYVSGVVVQFLKEHTDSVSVMAVDFSKNIKEFDSEYVIVSAGAINTVKILMKTFGIYNKKVKITSKPNVITPCIDVSFLGKTENSKKHSLCQLVLKSKNKINDFTSSYSQFYKYKSLLTFKLLNYLPITRPEAFSLLSILLPSIVIVDSRFPSTVDSYKTCELVKKDNKDFLRISYDKSKDDLDFMKKQMKVVKRGLLRLGLIPLKSIYMKEGTSAHYAGGVSSLGDTDSPLRADDNGKVDGLSRVFVADSSIWKALSAKPPTLTIMANANRIGEHLSKIIKPV